MDTLDDATNAFASTTPAAYAETTSGHAANEEHPMHDQFLQRQRNACFDIQAADGLLQVRPTMENLMGDRYIPSIFSLSCRRPLTKYAAGRIARSKDARRPLRKFPWLPGVPSLIDISTVAFADDIRVVHWVRISRKSTPFLEARRIMTVATDEALQLSREIAKEGCAQNLGKAELLPRLHETGAHAVLKEMTSWEDHPSRHRVATEARHLGPYCHFKFVAHKECLRRICAVKRSAPAACGLWRANTSHTTKRSALLAHVVGPLLSAIETVLYTSSEWKKFDRTICMYARRALNGRATTKTANPDGTITYRSWTNERVRKFWRLPTAQTEARVRRLKWAQELSVRPQIHCQVLPAMFGDVHLRGRAPHLKAGLLDRSGHGRSDSSMYRVDGRHH